MNTETDDDQFPVFHFNNGKLHISHKTENVMCDNNICKMYNISCKHSKVVNHTDKNNNNKNQHTFPNLHT